jgi:hypothetical protein
MFNMRVPDLLQYFQHTLIKGNVFSHCSDKTGEFGLSYTRQLCPQLVFHLASESSDGKALSRPPPPRPPSPPTAALLTLPTAETGDVPAAGSN